MAAIKTPIVIPVVEGWQGWTVLGLIGFMLVALVAELAPPHLVMMGTLVVLLALSILDVQAAFHGFADEAMLSVAVLFVVAKGIEQSGGLEYVASVLFRTPDKSRSPGPGRTPSKTEGSIVWVLLKFSVPVAIFSAFLANIPLVAMMIPPIVEFGKKVNLPASKMLMPLSYAAQLGGTMTIIGAGTNLVVLSMAAQKLPDLHMNIFEIGIVGVPITVAGIFYIIAFSGKLLPERVANEATTLNVREYNVVVIIQQTSRMAQKSIELSGLGRQPGLNLVAVSRVAETILNPTFDFVLQPKDRLHFVGVIDSVLLLAQIDGLKLTEDEGQGEVDLNRLKATQILVEAVIAPGSSMVQKRIADLQCRTRFNAVIVGVHRHGQRFTSLTGDIEVEAGDCLLMVADGPEFVAKHRSNSHFSLVAQLPGFKPVNRKKALIAGILVFSMIVASGVGMKLITAALFSSAGLLLTRCLTPQDALEAIELPVLIMIAAAFGIAEGMVESGAASILAKALMGLAGKSLFGLISCTYVATTVFSLAITNNAAVTIMFPVALAAANHQALDFRPFAYTLMMAASAGFMTPTACPTNLMVYSPGSYKFSDYIYYGGPLQIWLLFVTVGVTMSANYWWVWLILILALTIGATPLIARHKSTHPKPMPVVPPGEKSDDAGHDDENPHASLNAGGISSSVFMLAPGHADQESISRRASQSNLPSSSSPKSFPSSFPPPYSLDDSTIPTIGFSSIPTSPRRKDSFPYTFPPPYQLEDSSVPTGELHSTVDTPKRKDSFPSTFPPPYQLEDSSVPTGEFRSTVETPKRKDSFPSTFPPPYRLEYSSVPPGELHSTVDTPKRKDSFPSSLLPPYWLEDSSVPTGEVRSTVETPKRKDSFPSTFPPPYRLDDSSVPMLSSPESKDSFFQKLPAIVYNAVPSSAHDKGPEPLVPQAEISQTSWELSNSRKDSDFEDLPSSVYISVGLSAVDENQTPQELPESSENSYYSKSASPSSSSVVPPSHKTGSDTFVPTSQTGQTSQERSSFSNKDPYYPKLSTPSNGSVALYSRQTNIEQSVPPLQMSQASQESSSSKDFYYQKLPLPSYESVASFSPPSGPEPAGFTSQKRQTSQEPSVAIPSHETSPEPSFHASQRSQKSQGPSSSSKDSYYENLPVPSYGSIGSSSSPTLSDPSVSSGQKRQTSKEPSGSSKDSFYQKLPPPSYGSVVSTHLAGPEPSVLAVQKRQTSQEPSGLSKDSLYQNLPGQSYDSVAFSSRQTGPEPSVPASQNSQASQELSGSGKDSYYQKLSAPSLDSLASSSCVTGPEPSVSSGVKRQTSQEPSRSSKDSSLSHQRSPDPSVPSPPLITTSKEPSSSLGSFASSSRVTGLEPPLSSGAKRPTSQEPSGSRKDLSLSRQRSPGPSVPPPPLIITSKEPSSSSKNSDFKTLLPHGSVALASQETNPGPSVPAPQIRDTFQDPLILKPTASPFRTRQPLQETSSPSSSSRLTSLAHQDTSSLSEGSSDFPAFGDNNEAFDIDSFTDVKISDSPRRDSPRGKSGNISLFSKDSSVPRGGLFSKPPSSYLTTRNSPKQPIGASRLPHLSIKSSSNLPRSTPGAPTTASKVAEDDLTGGISNLLTSRRLSSLKDFSAFADNKVTH